MVTLIYEQFGQMVVLLNNKRKSRTLRNSTFSLVIIFRTCYYLYDRFINFSHINGERNDYMPKFSKIEKEQLREKLLSEGEKLFSTHGLKKVSVDELVNAVGIAKGSFYAFYTNKEHLFMDILSTLQNNMWESLNSFLIKNQHLPPHILVKQVFLLMLAQSEQYPILQQMDDETTAYLFKRLPPDVLTEHTNEDINALLRLQEYGVQFRCDIAVATEILQELAVLFLNLRHKSTQHREEIISIMLDGILHEIVGEIV